MMTSNDHAHNMALQKYMLLQEQHETLCTHLDRIRPSHLNSSGFTSSFSSPSTSPTRSTRTSSASPPSSIASSPSSSFSSTRRHSRSSERHHTRSSKSHARRSGWDDSFHRGAADTTLHTITDEDTLYEISAEEQRLVDVNVGIKRALMELLGCEGVRRDPGMRMWVQSRLMETEQELRMGRRRRSS